ncbi:RDD family protein [Microbacterium luticocti]|uniref:RDD family protein n=1 Tax=Microbacterium luticocti TaxID=451764 RepID=UPI000404AE31|nr:RDD family protein [Microbacterium luticocti]
MPDAPRSAPSGPATPSHPGERWGLPASGPKSVARFGRRLAALAIDIATAALIGYAFFGSIDPVTGVRLADPLATNLVFAAVQIVFIPTIGGSPGHRIMGMRLVRVHGGWVGLWRPVLRTALLFLVIPALIWDADHRGLHDKAAGTVLLRV